MGKIFKRDDRNAVFQGDMAQMVFNDSFSQAAEMVARSGLEHRGHVMAILPACYLYRHATELGLKRAIDRLERWTREEVRQGNMGVSVSRGIDEVDDELTSTHSLLALMRILSRRLGELSHLPEYEDEDLAELRRTRRIPDRLVAFIEEIHTVDASGQVFRYPRPKGRSWEQTIHTNHQVNLDALISEGDYACEYLRSVFWFPAWPSSEDAVIEFQGLLHPHKSPIFKREMNALVQWTQRNGFGLYKCDNEKWGVMVPMRAAYEAYAELRAKQLPISHVYVSPCWFDSLEEEWRAFGAREGLTVSVSGSY